MSHLFSMLGSIGSLIFDFITGIFAYIPQMMYFIYTCGASIIDMLQYVMRKLAGLDVYYINGQEQSGDILLSFFKGILGIEGHTNSSYSTLSTVFWSMVIFGVVLIFMTTIIKMIQTHYNYDPEESKPSTILKGSLKALFTVALIPLVTIFGVEISNTLLNVLDQISAGSTTTTMEGVYGNSTVEYSQFFKSGEDSWGRETYTSFDFFGAAPFTSQTTISGAMFQVAANKANRVRSTSYSAKSQGNDDGWSNLGIFTSTTEDDEDRREEVAYMIDYAFANCLKTQTSHTASVLKAQSWTLIPTYSYLQSAVWYVGTWNFTEFSKFNVGLVWYYYNLWSFNWFVGLIGLSIFLTLIINVVFGLITRLLMSVALFLVYPPLVGISPIDNKNAQGKWRQEFVGNILMAYGAIVGMNLCFMLLPFLQNISFFNNIFLDTIFNTVIVIAAMITVKEVIKIFSAIIGAKDANAEGEATKNEAKKAAFAAADKAVKAVKLAATVVAAVYTGGGAVAAKAAAKAAAKRKIKKEVKKKLQEKLKQKFKEKSQKEQREKIEQAKEQAEELKEEMKDAEEQAREAQAAEETKNPEDNFGIENEEEQQQEDAFMDKASLLRGKLDKYYHKDYNITDKDFGDEKAVADEAKGWYHVEREKRMANGTLDEEALKDEAVERFIDNSNYVKNKTEAISPKMQAAAEAAIAKRKEERREKFNNSLLGRGFIKTGRGIKKTGKAVGKGLKWAAEKTNFGEIAASSLTAMGSISGISGIAKEVNEKAAVADQFNGIVRSFGQALKISDDKLPDTEDSKKKKEESAAKAEASNRAVVKDYSEAILRQLRQINEFIDKS